MKMSPVRLVIILFLMSILAQGGCDGDGGGGDNCIDFSQFFNGQDAQTQTSEWDCVSGDFAFSFAVFEDGTGVTNALGIGEFEFQTGCRIVDVESALNFGSLNFQGPVEGGVEIGEASFTDVLIEIDGVELGSFDVSCILDLEPEDTLL